MTDLLAALGLAIALEGIVYALFPTAMQRMMASVLTQAPGRLRIGGLFAAATGVMLVWLVRGG